MSDFDVGVAKFLLPDTATTLEITISGFGTPKAAIFMVGNCYTTLEVERADYSWSFGATDGTREWYVGQMSQDVQGTANAQRTGANDGCIHLIESSSNGTELKATGVGNGVGSNPGPIANGWRISVTSEDTTVQRYAIAVFFTGSDLSAYAGLTPALGNQATTTNVTDPGFQADLVFFAGDDRDMSGSVAGPHMAYWAGACIPGVSDACIAGFSEDGVATSKTGSTTRNNRCCLQYFNHNMNWGATSGTNANGFDLTITDGNAAGDKAGYLALKVDNVGFSVDVIASPINTTSDWVITAPGFEPSAVILLQTNNRVTHLNESTFGAVTGMSAFNDTVYRTVSSRDYHAVATTEAKSNASDKISYLIDHDGATLSTMDFADADSKLTATGFTVKAADITAASGFDRNWICIAFEKQAAPTVTIPPLLSANPEVIRS